jgi:adenosylcobinamide hydrolase
MLTKELKLNIDSVKADIDVNTLLVSFKEKRRILSTWDGFKKVHFVANSYHPPALSNFTMKNYHIFEEEFPPNLGISPGDISFLSTGANMNNLAFCVKSFQDRIVCCLATGGVGNALRSGVDKAYWIEKNGEYVNVSGTINIILVTNVNLSDGAMARSIITATEAKTAALQDMDARSSISPENQATGTGTDNMIIISGNDQENTIKSTGGHTKMGELIGITTKIAVEDTIKKHQATLS